MLLDDIQFPEDLRKLKSAQVPRVCRELREHILKIISEKGGHLASNLGSVELTVALHYIFDTPKDRLVWDVGHQAYGHKILTGRKDKFSTIRQWGGISGFTSRAESDYDHFGAGHASTSISAAVGIAEGLRLKGMNHFAIPIIGDGSLTGGLAFEAMNNAGHIRSKNLLVVFNDNDMSIDPNVGAINKFVNRAVTHPGYNRLRKEGIAFLSTLSESGLPLSDIAKKLRRSLKNFFTPGILFECFGFRYFGPIDGHNVRELMKIFRFIKSEGPENGPYLVHAITTKGRGYKLAEQLPIKYHGVNPFPVQHGIQPSAKVEKNYQDIFAETLIKIAREDPRVVAITAAMPSGTGLVKFQKEFASRCYDVGIAEGHAVLFAAGLATEGYRPVVAIYSTFLQRAYDQIIHDVGLQNLSVIFSMDRAGYVGADGATHQGAFDITYLRTIPNFVLMAPKDENELQHMIQTAVEHQKGPIALRYPRGPVVGIPLDAKLRALPIGKGELLNTDHPDQVDVCLIAVGFPVQSALEAQIKLKEAGLKTAIINARFIKPLDEDLLGAWARASKLVVTVEENSKQGGFGSAVLELLSEKKILRPSLCLGMPDAFIEHGSQSAQRAHTGLDGTGIASQILSHWETLKAQTRPLKLADHRSPLQDLH